MVISVQTLSLSARIIARKRRISFSLWGSPAAVWHSNCTNFGVVECLRACVAAGRSGQCPSPIPGTVMCW